MVMDLSHNFTSISNYVSKVRNEAECGTSFTFLRVNKMATLTGNLTISLFE